jgi:hypothetical protein
LSISRSIQSIHLRLFRIRLLLVAALLVEGLFRLKITFYKNFASVWFFVNISLNSIHPSPLVSYSSSTRRCASGGRALSLKDHFLQKFCIRLVFCQYLAQFNPSISACFVFVFYSSLRFWWYNYFCKSPTSSTFRSILTSQFANFDISKTFFSISPISRNLAHDRKFCRVLDNNCCSWCL